MNQFSKLGLSDEVVEVLEKMGFETPTPIQAKAIPLILSKNPTDFIGLAQTGTGKTAAFGLPLIDLINHQSGALQAIILSPTRELSQQTAVQLKKFSEGIKRLTIELVYGGASIVPQLKALKGPVQILVATPGRLIDLIDRKAVKLDQVQYIILDEADEMLNMGFKEDIDNILSYTPEHRVTWLFSATMPPEIRRIVNKFMNNPVEAAVNTEDKSNKDITHQYVVTKSDHRVLALRRFLDIQPDMRGILFCRTKRETQQIADDLANLGYGVEALHGDLSQAQRDAVMKRFKARSMQLLIATDVAARGIDVNDLTHVIHHTLPDAVESYTHRSGRTGRAGKKGISLAFINPRELRRISELEKKMEISMERIEVPSISTLKNSRISHWANIIINTKVDHEADEILGTLQSSFSHLTKEDLLKRLITTQLDHLRIEEGEGIDLNEFAPQKGSSRSGASESRGGGSRYFINIGSIDGLTKGDLIHLISDMSKVDRQYIQDLSLMKNCSFFNVTGSQDKGFVEKFNGLTIDGRSIRVNKDEENPRKDSGESRDRKRNKPRPTSGGGFFRGKEKGRGDFRRGGRR